MKQDCRREFFMKNIAGALAAITAVALEVAGCTAAPGGHHGPAPHASASACTSAQLGSALEGSRQPGTGGTALASVWIWNKSASACVLPGPLTVAGLDTAGRRVTTIVRLTIAPGSPALSPDGTGPSKPGRMPAGGISASLLLIAAGTHPGNSAPSCTGHQIDPAAFRIALASGGSITAANASAARGPALTRDGGLMTCRGNLAGQSPILIARN